MTFKISYDKKMTFRESITILREWYKDDTFPWMKRKTVNFVSPYICYFSITIILSVHYFWAVETDCSVDFQRGGALIVLVSAFLFGWTEWHKPEGGPLGGGKIKKFGLFEPHFAIPLTAIIGTLLWGYGDLVPWLSKERC